MYVLKHRRPLLLDLFCGEGGAAMGYRRAGFEIVGVDIAKMPRYPYEFIRADIRKLGINLNVYDAIHASPPCKAHTPLRALWNHEHESLLPHTRELLSGFNGPWVIENVPGSWLTGSVTICGASLNCAIERPHKYYLRRHRLFAANFSIEVPPCKCAHYRNRGYKCLGVYGHGTHAPGDTIVLRRRIMGIPHASSAEISQAIPPKYTALVGHQMRKLFD